MAILLQHLHVITQFKSNINRAFYVKKEDFENFSDENFANLQIKRRTITELLKLAVEEFFSFHKFSYSILITGRWSQSQNALQRRQKREKENIKLLLIGIKHLRLEAGLQTKSERTLNNCLN